MFFIHNYSSDFSPCYTMFSLSTFLFTHSMDSFNIFLWNYVSEPCVRSAGHSLQLLPRLLINLIPASRYLLGNIYRHVHGSITFRHDLRGRIGPRKHKLHNSARTFPRIHISCNCYYLVCNPILLQYYLVFSTVLKALINLIIIGFFLLFCVPVQPCVSSLT